MSRPVDASRKPALVDQILEYLLDKSLGDLTFRTLAKGIGVSTYSLVYHFGTRDELLGEILRAISARAIFLEERLRMLEPTLDTYVEGLRMSWQWAIEPRNRQLQRLEFEAGMLETVFDTEPRSVRGVFAHWQAVVREALAGFGLSPEDAEVESRVIVSLVYGLQFDLVVNDDVEAATAAFDRGVREHRAAVESLLVTGPREPSAPAN